ncbi:MAG: glycoside hydrolase family 88 protein [Prolixibacteraceae bacterium]|jgi:unsaturated rhamnogalacturonyl hydrolase|nr:glycoside hydrolase family 88 protein [Prolixibacteraceae bacterium]
MSKRNLILFLLITAFWGCSSSKSNGLDEENIWSVKMANAVMARNDSLAFYNNPSSINWQYDIAMLGQAIERLSGDNAIYSAYHKNFIDYFVQPDGTIKKYDQSEYNLDYFNAAKGLIRVYKQTKDEKYQLALQLLLRQLENQPKAINGGYIHKSIYPNQIWLNSSYMLCPFLVEYAMVFDEPKWLNVACFQLQNTYNVTVDSKDGLLVHAWDESKQQVWANAETGKSPHKWSRGMGWYMMALVDAIEFLPKEHPQRTELIKIFKSLSKSLLEFKDEETGLWFQILNLGEREYNYLETSGSAMFIYVFAKGVNIGVLPSKYKAIAKESFLSLTQHFIKTDIDGLPTLTNISGSAGLGVKLHRDGSFEYYINQKPIDNDPKGMAPFIMAANELNL